MAGFCHPVERSMEASSTSQHITAQRPESRVRRSAQPGPARLLLQQPRPPAVPVPVPVPAHTLRRTANLPQPQLPVCISLSRAFASARRDKTPLSSRV
jgi:hypothetical protein